MTFEEREAHIKQQGRRRKRLRRLVEIFHRSRNGPFDDYGDTYEEFYETYLSARPEQDVPRYASCAEDETYGMIHLFETVEEAISDQAGIPSSGEYLNVPAGVYDLDCVAVDPTDNNKGGRVPYRMVAMSEDAYNMLCGIVQPSWDVNKEGVYGPWEEVQATFPLKQFRENAAVWDGASDPPEKGIYYWEEAGE